MPIEFTKDGSTPKQINEVRAQWVVKKGSGGQPEAIVDLHMGEKHICRAQIMMGDIKACKPLSEALLKMMEAEAPNFQQIIRPGSQEFNTIARLVR